MMITIANINLSGWGGLMPAFWGAVEEMVPVTTDATGSIDWIAELFKGGATSIVLILVAFVGVVFLIERIISVRRSRFIPLQEARRLEQMAISGDFEGIARACKGSSHTLGQIGEYIATHTHVPFEILSFGVSDTISRMVARQNQKNYPLAVVATISPLLGLLGTIIGMIEAFQKVALMGDTGDASVLADSIGKALITTAMGLMIAIPALAAYHYFKSRINSYGIQLEEAVDQLLAPWLHPEITENAETSESPVESSPKA